MTKLAIKPTKYKGTVFRSRLEARVAVFFDNCGMKWEYEPEAIIKDGSEYNPDFYLPETNDWVEVKGERPGWEKEILKARDHVSIDGPITRLVIISNIPDPNGVGLPHFPCYYATTERDPYQIKEGWYFFQDVGDGKAYGHISSGWEEVPPKIDKWSLNKNSASITPEYDIETLKQRCREKAMREISPHFGLSESQEEAFLSVIKDTNRVLFSAIETARQYDFVMKKKEE